eukprot:scaffold7351_cov259-Pinguiococcus_pyrenoidosus.AAC.25
MAAALVLDDQRALGARALAVATHARGTGALAGRQTVHVAAQSCGVAPPWAPDAERRCSNERKHVQHHSKGPHRRRAAACHHYLKAIQSCRQTRPLRARQRFLPEDTDYFSYKRQKGKGKRQRAAKRTYCTFWPQPSRRVSVTLAEAASADVRIPTQPGILGPPIHQRVYDPLGEMV